MDAHFSITVTIPHKTAILDMLGIIANKPAGQLIGELLNPEVAIYLGTRLSDLRRKEPEVSLELVKQDWQETKAGAIKIRAGRGDNLGQNNENAPGRTEKLIRMTRDVFGDDIDLMIDGNGTYDVLWEFVNDGDFQWDWLVAGCKSDTTGEEFVIEPYGNLPGIFF